MPAIIEQRSPDVDAPLAPSQVAPTAIMVGIAMLGGALSFYRSVKAGKARPFNVAELVGEVATSGFSGLLAWWVFQGLNVNPYLTAAGVGVVGHMGSRALFLSEQLLEGWVKQLLEKWARKTGT
jgi:hypothetical protein